MKGHSLEARINGIIRWLLRLKASYSRGHVETAYMDAVCAVADLDGLKSDILASLPREPSQRNFRVMARVVFLAAIIVMIYVKPLMRDIVPAVQPEIPPKTAPADEPKPSLRPPVSKQPSKQRPARRQTQRQETVKRKTPAPAGKTIAHDKVTYLLQAGQRAMKNDKSVIMVK